MTLSAAAFGETIDGCAAILLGRVTGGRAVGRNVMLNKGERDVTQRCSFGATKSIELRLTA